MIESVLRPKNMTLAYRQVVSNKGSAGVDGMKVYELKSFIDDNRTTIALRILNRKYIPQAIKGVEIPKPNGKSRLLGVPTVVDRWLQQAVSQQLASQFELEFEEESHGFRPKRNAQKAVQQSLKHINDGYQDIVDIDLKSFFDEVQHYKILQLIYEKVKCPTTLWLIRKWLRAPILVKGRLHKRRKGVPQGSPLSPLLSNIMLDQLDKYLKANGCRFVRYADDCEQRGCTRDGRALYEQWPPEIDVQSLVSIHLKLNW
jgi:RNA-directed DNA polymerase